MSKTTSPYRKRWRIHLSVLNPWPDDRTHGGLEDDVDGDEQTTRQAIVGPTEGGACLTTATSRI